MRNPLRQGIWSLCLLCLALLSACVDKAEGGSTQGTSLYLFDTSAGAGKARVLVWNDVQKLYDNPLLSADRSIAGPLLDEMTSLSWGGMAFDSRSGRLYLVSETGKVVRIERARSANGTLSNQNDIDSFTLDNGGSTLVGSIFGQACVDPSTGTLYIAESGDTACRIWVIAHPENYGVGTSKPPFEVLQADAPIGGPDTSGLSVTVSNGTIFGAFGSGGSVPNPPNAALTGARLRAKPYASSSFSQCLIGDNTQLGSFKESCLAVDTSGRRLFVLRNDPDKAPIQIFLLSDFRTGAANQAPSGGSMGDWTAQPGLRIIAHGGSKNWLVGASDGTTAGASGNRFHLWANPSGGVTARQVTLDASAIIRGLALDGNN